MKSQGKTCLENKPLNLLPKTSKKIWKITFRIILVSTCCLSDKKSKIFTDIVDSKNVNTQFQTGTHRTFIRVVGTNI